MRSILVGLALVDFVLFALALRTVFAHVTCTPVITRLMVIAGTAFGCLHTGVLATVPLHPYGAWIAVALYIVSGVLFCWTAQAVKGRAFQLAYCGGGPSSVVSSGPYRWVRHPFYLSYTLAWFAGVAAAGDLLLLPTVAIMLAFYVGAASGEERRLLSGPAAADYEKYRCRVGLLIPRF